MDAQACLPAYGQWDRRRHMTGGPLDPWTWLRETGSWGQKTQPVGFLLALNAHTFQTPNLTCQPGLLGLLYYIPGLAAGLYTRTLWRTHELFVPIFSVTLVSGLIWTDTWTATPTCSRQTWLDSVQQAFFCLLWTALPMPLKLWTWQLSLFSWTCIICLSL